MTIECVDHQETKNNLQKNRNHQASKHYLQMPQIQRGKKTPRKDSGEEYHSDCSTQIGDNESHYNEDGTRNSNGNVQKENQGHQTSQKPDTNQEDYELATIKKPKKQFNSNQERDKFVKNYQMKFKTEMCRNWELTGKCKFQNSCSFAHGKEELMKKKHLPENYKTKLCVQFHTTSYCPYGNRC